MSDERRQNGENGEDTNGLPADLAGLPPWTAEGAGAQLVLAYSRLGFTQRTFADLLEKTARQLRRYEVAEQIPGIRARTRILEVLGGQGADLWQDPELRDLSIALGVPRQRRWIRLAMVTAAVLAIVTIGYFVIRQPTTSDPLVHVEPSASGPWEFRYASGRHVAIAMKARNGSFSWNTGPRQMPFTRIGKLDARGRVAAIVVSLDVATPNSPTGQLRADFFDARARLLHTAWLDDAPAYGDTTLASNVWSLETVQFLDWDGNPRTMETLLVATHTWFPSVLTILGVDGERVRTYAHAGHIRQVVAVTAASLPSLVQQAGLSGNAPHGVALGLTVEYNDAPRCAGLVILLPGFDSGANAVSDVSYRHDQLRPLRQAHYVRFLPSLSAQRCPAGQNWPEELHYDSAMQRWQLTTLEEPEGNGIIRYLDQELHQVRITPTDSFRHKYAALAQQYDLPPLNSEAFAASVESVLVYQNGTWTARRDRGAWQP